MFSLHLTVQKPLKSEESVFAVKTSNRTGSKADDAVDVESVLFIFEKRYVMSREQYNIMPTTHWYVLYIDHTVLSIFQRTAGM